MDLIFKMDHIYKIYELILQNDNSKHLILEPLSCVLKIGLLNVWNGILYQIIHYFMKKQRKD